MNIFLKNIGCNKLFLTFMSAFTALCISNEMFKVNMLNGLILIIAVIFFQLSIQIFDDFMDWVLGQTKKRNELEQLGIRGNFNKCIYIYKDKSSPRRYLLASILFFFIATILLSWVCYVNSNFYLLILLPILFLFAILIYTKSGNKIVRYIGNEFFIALLCGPLTMFVVFYGMTKYITIRAVIVGIIMFFFIYNICYISSLLNYKADKMIQKLNLPVIMDKSNWKIYISLLLAIIPYIITVCAIISEILPKISYATLLLLPYSIWLFYLMYMFEYSPQKPVKWHFMMGVNKYKTEDEQNNISWYTTRYKFARNIFVIYTFILIFSLINYNEIL